MRYSIVTIFPEIFSGFLQSSLIGKGIKNEIISIDLHNPRTMADPPHYKVDDTPYGGGAGMVMLAAPLSRTIESLRSASPDLIVALLTPSGHPFKQAEAESLSKLKHLALVCGRYEGIDQRFIDQHVDLEISIGDFITMGGEVGAMAVIEATARLLPEMIGNPESVVRESFQPNSDGHRLLEAPQYTRPEVFEGLAVPSVLISGDHKKIDAWRKQESERLTQERRPDLFKHNTSEEE